MPELDLFSLLSGGIVGGFVGAFAKFFWENGLPSLITWRRQLKVAREKFISQFRDPAMRATTELQNRIYSLLMTDNIEFLKQIGREDYYITSTVFLLAQYFAWAEILRRKASMLDYSELVMRIESVSHSFSSGGPGFQIFHLEQREIGERMFLDSSDHDDSYRILGYADFIEVMMGNNIPACFSQLRKQVNDLIVPNEKTDLPKEKLIQIQNALVDLMEFIDPKAKWVPKKNRIKVVLK